MRTSSRPSTIVIMGLAGAALAVACLSAPARAAGPETTPNPGVVETSPLNAPVRTYSNGARVPVPQPDQTGTTTVDPAPTGSVAPDPRRVPNPETTRNPLGCPQIDPLCQGR